MLPLTFRDRRFDDCVFVLTKFYEFILIKKLLITGRLPLSKAFLAVSIFIMGFSFLL